MRTAVFHYNRELREWTSRPFQGWEYRIIRLWLKGYALYFNGRYLAGDTKIRILIHVARKHLAENHFVKEVA